MGTVNRAANWEKQTLQALLFARVTQVRVKMKQIKMNQVKIKVC